MLKHFSLVQSQNNQQISWKLINNAGSEVESFSLFSNLLNKKYSFNTRKSYCKNIAIFLDFLEEVDQEFEANHTNSFLLSTIEAFPEWLLYGEQSSSEIVMKIQKTYPAPNFSKSTVDIMMSSVRIFLEASEKLRLEKEEMDGTITEKLIPEINEKKVLNISQINSLKSKSLLSGVIANGPKLINMCILPIKKSQTYFAKERAFPFDKVIETIDAMTSYRDKALYMFCAASGCRMHEALQILIEDIDLITRSINLIDPHSRINNLSYKILTPKERDLLSWKGRDTPKTVLIQPFGDLFFEYLEKYIKEEYLNHKKHSFIFQHIRGKNKGKPYFLSATSTRHEIFDNAIKKMGIKNALSQGVHSLRHMYGTYLLNYFPKKDGTYGLPLAVVQKVMGHSSISATQKYARHDEDIIRVELEYANSLIYFGQGMDLVSLKRKALKSQLEKLEVEYAKI